MKKINILNYKVSVGYDSIPLPSNSIRELLVSKVMKTGRRLLGFVHIFFIEQPSDCNENDNALIYSGVHISVKEQINRSSCSGCMFSGIYSAPCPLSPRIELGYHIELGDCALGSNLVYMPET